MFSTRKVYRNGLIFQIPVSVHCSFRYTVHPDGTGTGWDENAPDVDQPHGLDYRSHQDIRKAVRKRLSKEHKTPADNTAGGEHLAGGCRILGIVDSTSDLTAGAGDASYDITDGKFQGRGIVYDQTSNKLWCFTGDGTVSDDPYALMWGPESICLGADYTWTGAHEFDASIDITGSVAIDGDLTMDGAFEIDGTSNFNDEVDFSAVNISGNVGALTTWAGKISGTVYQATTDGLVLALGQPGNDTSLLGYSDPTTNPPTTLKAASTAYQNYYVSIMMPVNKGYYWKVVNAGAVYWVPIGSD